MKSRLPFFTFGVALFALAGQITAHAAGALNVGDVIQKAVARGQADQQDALPDFVYRKLTVTDQLDNSGNVKEHKEKIYEVAYRDGHSHATLLQVDGHTPSPADLKQQSQNETSIRQITGDAKPANGDGQQENFLTPELAQRYDFKLIGQTNVRGRMTYQIAFQPKDPVMPVHRLVDKLLNQISGTLWIDAQEFEVARADISLRSEVNILGGIAGTLKKLAYTLERTRIADGVWFSTLSSGDFQGRKLFDPTHIKTKTQSVEFRRVAMNGHVKPSEG